MKYRVKIFEVSRRGECEVEANHKREAISIVEGKMSAGKIKFRAPVVSPIYLVFRKEGKEWRVE